MKTILTFLAALAAGTAAMAQSDENFKYQRSSLCMMMVECPTLEFNNEIEQVFAKMDIPSRFNSHDMGVRFVKFAYESNQQANITQFGQDSQLAKRFVSKWFGRNKNTGAFNTELVRERGHYNATKIDVAAAMRQARGTAILEDMGENLISHTYWVVNDIRYVNQANFFKGLKDATNLAINSAEAINTKNAKVMEKAFGGSASGSTEFLGNIKGFRVKVTSYLYRLRWNEEIANTFYEQYYTENPGVEPNKVAAFKNDKSLFSLEYIGSVTNTSSKTSLSGVTTNEDIIRKVCTRALDKNIADLQHQFADFRIKAPLVSVSPVKAYVGMKEDITEKSRYEVLEDLVDEEGRHHFRRVGIIRPIPDKIWDNRYMADLEHTAESSLDATYFEKVSGGEFYQGMLIREIK